MLKEYYVYIIECSNGRLYTGYTVDLEKRFNEHLSGRRGAKFTRAFKPREISASWKVSGVRGDAMRIEAFIKSLSKADKTAIASEPESLIERMKLMENIKCEISVFNYKTPVKI